MQKYTFLFFFLTVQVFNVQSQSSYQIESCKIEFIYYNGIAKGTKTIIFADSGRIEKQLVTQYVDTANNSDIQQQFIGNRTVYHILQIQTQDSVFSIDLDLMIGSKRARFNIDMSSYINNEKKKIGEGIFLNKKCDITDFSGFNIWYWKGLALKKEMTISPTQQVYETATLIDEHYLIKEDEFKVPIGVKMK